MKIIPVIDLLGGCVVRGISGEREKYQPVESLLTNATDPLSIAKAFRDQLGLDQIYLADLDAILTHKPHYQIYESLAAEGFCLMIDPGIRSIQEAQRVLESGAEFVIAGLETVDSPLLIEDLIRTCSVERVIFSLDLQQGQSLGNLELWETTNPIKIGYRVIEMGIRQMIVLDLQAVGAEQGVTTTSLCENLRQKCADLTLLTGGGVRDIDDLRQLAAAKVDGVLIATALHQKQISADDMLSF